MLNNILKKDISYINSWNFFSKSILIKNYLKNNNLLIVIIEKQKYFYEYKNILSFLNEEIKQITNIHDYINIKKNNIWLYFILAENLNKNILSKYEIEKDSISLNKNQNLNEEDLINLLNKFWYKFNEYEMKWSYKKIWDTITIVDFNYIYKYQISFWWDNIEDITIENLSLWIKKNIKSIEKISLGSNKDIFSKETNNSILELIKNKFCIIDSLDFTSYYNTLIQKLDNFCLFDLIWNKQFKIQNLWIKDLNIESLELFKNYLKSNKYNKIIYTKNIKLINDFILFNNLKNIKVYEIKINKLKSFKKDIINNKTASSITSNFSIIPAKAGIYNWKDAINNLKWQETIIVICDDIISNIFIKRRIKKTISQDINLLLKIKQEDYVVHIDHWIGVFKWIKKKEITNIDKKGRQRIIRKEYIEIEYKENDKLFVPITESNRISKYIWNENPKLTTLNSKQWERKIKKVSEDIQIIANDLLQSYAKRQINNGYSFIIYKKQLEKFQKLFPFTYTKDQENAINDIFNDMSLNKNMDRLLVWDVGFWKTEIAFNAVFNAFLNKKQTIFISPLVVLAYEHFEKAKERFKSLWVKIEILTRLENQKNTNIILDKLKKWSIDLIIWTHKLLNENIEYKNLWLIIIDEEHKFWVKDKEKIKKFKNKIDLLSMSATPIPRSLNMALSSIRELSILKHAPIWRKSIKTYVTKYDEKIIFDALKKEFDRWWQVFFIHNKIKNIEIYKQNLSTLFPDKKIIVTHSKLNWIEIEKNILDFKNKKYDILLSTTVIENWIDFPNVNTIFINECQNFGISQIHQLRWRVWRSDKKAYCYLLYKKENLWTDTAKRLKTIVEYSYLWAWFELAMKDLEIRWSWDILWIRQSWQAKEIWINLFIKMLEEKVEELKQNSGNNKKDNIDIKIDLSLESFISDKYFTSEIDKLNFYREIETLTTINDLNNLINSFKKINSDFDKNTKNLFYILKLKLKSRKFFIKSIKKIWVNYQIDFHEHITLDKLKEFLKLDKEVKFTVISINRLRTSIKNFENDELFLQYMLQLFDLKIRNKKFKLKS